MPTSAPSSTDSKFDVASAYPNSTTVVVEGPHGVRVPMREVALAGGELPVRLYDTSGPQGTDVRVGMPRLREPWIVGRGDTIEVARTRQPLPGEPVMPGVRPGEPMMARRGGGAVTHPHYARQLVITPEMALVAIREGLDAEFVRSEIARGRAIITANINHPESEPMIIGLCRGPVGP